MKFFINDAALEPSKLTGPAMNYNNLPSHFFCDLRIELARDEFLTSLGDTYEKLVAELRADIEQFDDAEDYEREAIKWPQLDGFIDNAPEHLWGIFDTYLWTELQNRILGSPESEWEYVAATFKSISVGPTMTIQATAFHVRPFEHDARNPK